MEEGSVTQGNVSGLGISFDRGSHASETDASDLDGAFPTASAGVAGGTTIESDTRIQCDMSTVARAAHLPSPLPSPTLEHPRRLSEPQPRKPGMPPTGFHDKTSSSEPSTGDKSAEEMSSESALSIHEPEPAKGEPAESASKTRSRSETKSSTGTHSTHDGVRRLSASGIQALTEAPESLPVASISKRPTPSNYYPLSAGLAEASSRPSMADQLARGPPNGVEEADIFRSAGTNTRVPHAGRPSMASRTVSTPPTSRRRSSGQHSAQSMPTRRNSYNPGPRLPPLDLNFRANAPTSTSKLATNSRPEALEPAPPSPMPPSIPLPPMSIPTLLQLELAAGWPSPLYIHHSHASDQPYESTAVKFERLLNFLLLPPHLERTMNFGALACLDAWLWTFTILPIRFCVALGVLARWWGYLIAKETRWLVGFVWYGLGRIWKRNRRGRPSSRRGSHESTRNSASETSRSRSRAPEVTPATTSGNVSYATGVDNQAPPQRRTENGKIHGGSSAGANGPKRAVARSHHSAFRHRRTKSMPSTLTAYDKADLLQGLVIICSSVFLMNLDASRMYHFIRAQSAMKLYVIYNVLEVSDRLLSAAGQDIMECLFSSETLSRNSSGRSKVLLPFFMFLLSLAYNTLHAVSLFYQVTTLNVAVNSYSNALLSLLISNQFVEIKGSVFKRFEKDNTFQLTCADIVERFQLWIMLLIIGMRNVVEVGGLSVPGAGDGDSTSTSLPLHTASVLPDSFTLLPSWLLSGEVLSPFVIVIGSEMLVDWIKHAFINKFNNIKPNFYGRVLDILCKDYYTNAFVTPSLTRRLGLPLLPLSCLFIRASVQTYHMFLATRLPAPIAPSTQTSLSVESVLPSATASSQAVVAALDRLDSVIRSALGRAVYGFPDSSADGATTAGVGPLTFWRRWTSDDAIAAVTFLLVFLLVFLALLVVKLVLGMALLRYARDRYAAVKAREHAVASGKAEREVFDAKGTRVGGYGHVEVGEERRRWVFADDPEGLRKAREKERRAGAGKGEEKDLGGVVRYEMVAKRIW